MSSPSLVAAAPVSDTDAVVAAWVAIQPDFGRRAPNLQKPDGAKDKWVNWALAMGSSAPSAVSIRASSPAKEATVRKFQDILCSYLSRVGVTRDGEKSALLNLHPAVKAAQLAYREEREDDESD